MKLKQPDTWERRLSQAAPGTATATWEALVREDNIPFTAMLRNLRNLVIRGVDPQVHDLVSTRRSTPCKSTIV